MLPTELLLKCTFKGALPLVVLAVKMAAKTGVYVPIVEAVCLFVMVTCWLEGSVQPCILLKPTVCDPTLRFHTVAPHACHAPPSTFHIAPSGIAPAGLIITLREPCCALAEQLAFVPPFTPWHVQDHGPEPLTGEAAPVLQRLEVGAEVQVPPLLLPHTPFTSILAEQFAAVPPFDPAQVQFHGPTPVTVEAVPALQRFDVGTVKKACPFAEPHTPFTA